MKITFIGQRGVPATFGGIERHVEEIGARLAAKGHEVVVYTRSNYSVRLDTPTYRGMEVAVLPTIQRKHLDALVPSIGAAALATRAHSDVVHFHAIGPGVGAAIARLRPSTAVVQTIHGLDHQRAKWDGPAQLLLRGAAWMSAHVPDEVIVVSQALADHYADVYGARATYITNGVEAQAPLLPGRALARFGLEPRRYILFVGRLVPEKAPDVLIKAFRTIDDPAARLALVGGSSFTNDYVNQLNELAAADPRVVLTDYQYGDDLRELYSNAAGFVLPSFLEGLPLTLLEGASYGLPVVASDISPHVEVLGSDGPGHRLVVPGDVEGLAPMLKELLAGGDALARGARELRTSTLDRYSWDRAADATEELYREVLRRRSAGRSRRKGVSATTASIAPPMPATTVPHPGAAAATSVHEQVLAEPAAS
jgi:glycosyltransferase involved in cell wall biosynthesis